MLKKAITLNLSPFRRRVSLVTYETIEVISLVNQRVRRGRSSLASTVTDNKDR